MNELFYTMLNMSISASILVLVVLLLRLVFRKAPKWMNVLLWALVAVRLICPFAVESPFSLMPKTEWIVQDSAFDDEMYFDSISDDIPIDAIGDIEISDDVTVHYYPAEPHIEIHQGISVDLVLILIWQSGIAVMLFYMLVSYICVYRRIKGSTKFRDNIYTSNAVSTPFVFGIVKPRIYLPENIDAVNMSYVIAHEEAHLRRHDHWWKPIGFILLTVHWFNPIIWLAYILLCRDIEMACDERVVREMGERERVDYSEALLDCSVNRRMITACPLAFGENNVKERIRTVLDYKKPAFWIVILAVIACAVAAVCFLTNPLGDMFSGDKTLFIYYDDPAEVLHYPYQLENDTVVNVKFKSTQSPKTVSLEIFCRKSSIFDEWQKSDMATLKLGETASFTVPEGHMFMIEAGRDSGTNGNVTFEITYGENKVHDSVLIEKEDIIDMIPDDKKRLTLADVITLSVKGSDLKWEDFAGYSHIVTGSGLYIHVYEIDENFELWIGGGSPIGTPSYIYLTLSEDIDIRIDIRDDGVEEFIHLHQKINLDPTEISNEDKVNFAYTLLTDSLEFTDPKTQIYSKMLNAIDYYNSAHIVKIAARAPFARQNRATVPEERASPYSGKNSMLKYSRHTKV